MTCMTAAEARKHLATVLDRVAASHEPVQIAGKRHSAVLIAEEDWWALQEARPGPAKDESGEDLAPVLEISETDVEW